MWLIDYLPLSAFVGPYATQHAFGFELGEVPIDAFGRNAGFYGK